mmetsp:Transcript_82359/g.191246  ORF Transcript_82359/g.191246 Transcript_82359/m.191246 type:complete len:274 (+) Transcript_82359:71-892(+)
MYRLLICWQVLSTWALHPAGRGNLTEEEGQASKPPADLLQFDLKVAAKHEVDTSVRKALQQLHSSGADSARGEVEATLQHALGQLQTAGLSDGEVALTLRKALSQLDTGAPPKDKIALMLIEMFPPTWFFGVDRFYLGCYHTAVAKLAVSLGACLLGLVVWRCVCPVSSTLLATVSVFSVIGFVWGLVDYFAVVINALRSEHAIHCLSMHAQFYHGHIRASFVLGIVNLLVIPMYLLLARFAWHWRKNMRMSRLRANALKSPLFQNKAPIRGG